MIDVLLEMLKNSVGIIGYRNHSQKLLNIICRNPNIKKIYVYCYKKNLLLKLKKKANNRKITFIQMNWLI